MFPPTVRRRARALLSGRAVTLLRLADEELEASVADDGAHSVTARVPFEDAPTLACTCDSWARGTPCAHIWAAIVEADRAGLPSLRDRRVVSTPDAAQARGSDWEGRLIGVRSELAAAARRGELPGAGAVRGDLQILYVLDRRRTRRGGGLAVNAFLRRRLRSGRWGTTRALSGAERDNPVPLDPTDRTLLALLRGASAYRDESARVDAFLLPPPHAVLTLPALCRTGRLLYEEPRGEELDALSWDEEGAWTLVLDVRTSEGEVRGCGRLVRGERDLPIEDADLVIAEGLAIVDRRIAPLDTGGAGSVLRSLLDEGPLRAPAADAPELTTALFALPALPAVHIDGAPLSIAPAPTGHLDVDQSPGAGGAVVGRVYFQYGDHRIAAGDLRAVLPVGAPTAATGDGEDGDDNRVSEKDAEQPAEDGPPTIRDREGEAVLLGEVLSDVSARVEDGADLGEISLAAPAASVLLERLLAAGWTVSVAGRRRRTAGTLSGGVTSGIDWFELRGAVEFDDQSVELPDLLRAARDGATVVPLPDGSQGMLPADLSRRLALLGILGEEDGDALRFGRHQGWLLDALVAGDADVTTDDEFEQFRAALASFDGIAPGTEPPTFQGELREYQREGLAWFAFLRQFGCGGCLADDMGLGKTVQVLALLEARRADDTKRPPSLVVAPRSVVFNWIDEAARFTPELKVLDYSGPGRRKHLADAGKHDLIVTTYGVLRRDGELMSALEFDYAVLDESQAVKNASTQVARAARLLRARHKLALSGTPIENHLEELWSLFEFLNPGMLGRSSAFRRMISRRGAASTDREGRALLARALRPFLLRRTKEQVAKDLPPKTEQTLHCEMTPRQRRSYRELARHYRTSLLARGGGEVVPTSRMHVLEALLRLRQTACHPGLLDVTRKDEECGKLDALLPMLTEVVEEGHKALVFSQFTSFLALVRDRLDKAGIVHEYLDGKTRDRRAAVDRFQNDDACPVFVISLKAGGLGLNLTAADYVFILDPWWNPAAEAQAIDRTYRIGQTRRVMAYRLVCRDTVEERVLELQEKKRELVAALLTEDNAMMRNLTVEDLELLLR